MLRKNFPFKQISPLDMPRPMLPIVIKNRNTGDSIFAWGLIDTGADSCAIPAKYADILGHRLKAGDKINIGTGNGSTCAYAHTTEIDILSVDNHGYVDVNPDKLFSIPETKIHYMPFSMQFYHEARRESSRVCRNIADSGKKTVSFLGIGELAEITYLGVKEWGLELKEVYGDEKKKSGTQRPASFFGL